MMINRKSVTHVYAVIRCDKFHRPDADVQTTVTVKEIHPTMEIAAAEVERLNKLAEERGVESVYWWQTTRWRDEPLQGMEVVDPR
jgi:hypothetical protein